MSFNTIEVSDGGGGDGGGGDGGGNELRRRGRAQQQQNNRLKKLRIREGCGVLLLLLLSFRIIWGLDSSAACCFSAETNFVKLSGCSLLNCSMDCMIFFTTFVSNNE